MEVGFCHPNLITFLPKPTLSLSPQEMQAEYKSHGPSIPAKFIFPSDMSPASYIEKDILGPWKGFLIKSIFKRDGSAVVLASFVSTWHKLNSSTRNPQLETSVEQMPP